MTNSAENAELTPIPLIGGLQPDKHELRQVSIDDNPAPEFDYYRATVHSVRPSVVIGELQRAYPLASTRQTAGKWGYDRSVQLYAGDKNLCKVLWSSNGQNSGTCIDTPGGESRTVRDSLQCFEHKVTRADIRIDYVEDGLFDYLASFYMKFAQDNKLKINQQGDWARGKARTLYVGSRQSAAMIRLYEKGHKEGGNPFWIRLEFEFKPQKETGYSCAALQPYEYLGMVQWIRITLDRLGIDFRNEGTKIGAQRKPENIARSRLAMTSQYARVFEKWMAEYDDANEFLAAILQTIYLQDEHKNAVNQDEKQAIFFDLLDHVEGKASETGRRHGADDRARSMRSVIAELQLGD